MVLRRPRHRFATVSAATFALLWAAATAAVAHAQGTAFTYQGRLSNGTAGVTGLYDFQFRTFDAPSAGNSIGTTISLTGIGVTNGLFTVTLDFGANVFTGAARYLDLAAKTNGSVAAFVPMTPRQPLTPAPYAIRAASAETVVNGSIGTPQLTAGAVAQANLAIAGTAAAGKVLGTSGSGLAWVDAPAPTGAWSLGGNAATTPDSQFIGTTDNQPLVFKVQGKRVLRIEPGPGGAPNLIGGADVNFVAPGIVGATIGGGGYSAFAFTNSVLNNMGTVGGGAGNQVSGEAGTVGGGIANSAEGKMSAIGGGVRNVASGIGSFVGGGGHDGSGFLSNRATGNASVIGGGMGNEATNTAATVAGGYQNQARGIGTFVGGGTDNLAVNDLSVVGGGISNTNSGYAGTIAGGQNNWVTGGNQPAIGGGYGNQATAHYATIAGGQGNLASGPYSVAAGYFNQATNNGSVVSGGGVNLAGGFNATIPGGAYNVANGTNSFAAGQRARAMHTGAFVWADSQPADFTSSTDNSFNVRASGGVRLVTGGAGLTVDGVPLVPNSNNNSASLSGNQLFTGSNTFTNALTVGTTAGKLTLQGENGIAVGIAATGGPNPGHLRVRNAVEVFPSADGAHPGYLDVRGTNGIAIALHGDTGAVEASGAISAGSLTTTGDATISGNLTARNTPGVNYQQGTDNLIIASAPQILCSEGNYKPATGFFIINAHIHGNFNGSTVNLSLVDVSGANPQVLTFVVGTSTVNSDGNAFQTLALNWVVPITTPGGYQNFGLQARTVGGGTATIFSHNLTVLYVPRQNN